MIFSVYRPQFGRDAYATCAFHRSALGSSLEPGRSALSTRGQAPNEAREPTERYEFIERIAVGGMAEIFLARARTSSGHERQVAVKRMLPSLSRDARFVEMFIDEANLAMRLSHANIVHTYDAGTDGEAHYLVMELIDGVSLRILMQRVVEAGSHLTIPVACFIAMEVCKGLAYAHSRTYEDGRHLSIVHRDLSPPNILVSRDGQVKITDFGLARALSHARVSKPGVVKGRYAYLAPEALDGSPSDQRGDIFAVGVCLWEMLAGRRLFLGTSEEDTIDRVRACAVPSLRQLRPEVEAELEELLGRALAPRPGSRVTTAREFGDLLARYLFDRQLKVTSYDLSTVVRSLLDPDTDHGSDADLDALIARELAAQAALSGPPESVVEGSVPLDPAVFEHMRKARYDLERFWEAMDSELSAPASLGAPEARTPTLDAMESASSPMALSRMLEGKLPVTEDSLNVQSHTMNEAQGAPDQTRWLIVAVLVSVAGAYVFFGF
jgi:serine/threonine protein kinase